MKYRHPLLLTLAFLLSGCPDAGAPPSATNSEPAVGSETPTPAPAPQTAQEPPVPPPSNPSDRPGSVKPTVTRAVLPAMIDGTALCDAPPLRGRTVLKRVNKLRGDVLSQKPETFFLPPWEDQFGRDYIGPQGIAAGPGGRLYLCSGVDEMIVIDASDPHNVKPLHRIAPSTHLPALEPRLGMAVLHHRIDAGEENIPNHWGRCQHIAIEGNTLYFAHRGDHFRPNAYLMAYDLTENVPRHLAVHPSRTRHFEGFTVHKGEILTAMHDKGLGIYQHSGDTFTAIAELGGLGNAWDVARHGDHGFVVSADGSLHVVNIQTREKPRLIRSLPIQGSPRSIQLSEDGLTAYIAAGSEGLLVIDIGTPSSPRLVTRIDTPGSAVGLHLEGERLVLSDWNDTRLFSLSNPRAPELMTVRTIQEERAVSRTVASVLRGEHLFLAEWYGLHSFRIQPSDPLPDLQIRRNVIHFGNIGDGEGANDRVHVQNEGSAPLEITHIVTTQPNTVVATNLPLVIPPHESRDMLLSIPTDTIATDTSVAVCSNDPDTPGFVLHARVNEGASTLGMPAVEVELLLMDGTPWKLSDHRGKTVLLAYFATF